LKIFVIIFKLRIKSENFIPLALLISAILLPEGSADDPPLYTEAQIRSAAVELRATVSPAVPRVTLHWNPSPYSVTGQTVSRRIAGTTAWEFNTVLAPSAVSWSDSTAANQTLYEYRVERVHSSPLGAVAEGWIWAGSEVPAVENRGRVILAVDATMASPLEAELDRLGRDLEGDGWEVLRTDVPRTATPAQARDAIRGWYALDPARTRAVLLVGRIPVAYSGQICPDGHWDPPPKDHHRGAWPTDAYYGDMDGVWTDSIVNYTVANMDGTRNHNVPGDGKFDVSLLVGEHLPEMAVGRIDLSNLGGISGGLSETELLRRYLDRLHAFRHRQGNFAALGQRALVDDNTFGPEFGFPAAVSGWTSGVALFGPSNTVAGDWVPALLDQDHLVAYGFGPGTFTGAEGVGSSADFRDTRCRAVFNLLFGSFFGDWDSTDNYLRAPLASRADSSGLVSLWSGVPAWRLFPLAAGGTMVDAYRHVVREVNQPNGPFPPTDESWTNPDQCHLAIMGDPTLRSHPPKPVVSVNAGVSGSVVTLSWSNPAGESNRLGCRVYRSTEVHGPFLRTGSQTSAGATTFNDTPPHPGRWYYLVRSVKRETTASASYDNLSQGILVEIDVPTTGYAAWSAGLGDPGETADPNQDGIPNLLAYALGAATATAPTSAILPRQDGPGFLVPYSGRPDLVYEVERSLNLAAWFTVARRNTGGAWSLNATSGYPHQAAVSFSEAGGPAWRFSDATSATRGFWRLRVTR
jgi:hypothetical protein